MNDSIELSAPTNQNYSYSWSPNYGISNTSIFNPFVYSLIDTTYFLALTDTVNCTNYDSIGLSINELPVFSISSLEDSLCLGDTTVLTASATNLSYSYSWSPSSSLSNDTILNPSVFPSSNTYFTAIATDTTNCSNRDSIFITVLDLPIADAGNDTATCPGVSVQLNGSGGITPQWLTSNSLSALNIYDPVASPSSLAIYILKVTDFYGCIDYDTIQVDVFANAVANAGNDIDTCANTSILLQASGGISYLWYDSLYLNHNDIANPLAYPEDDMTFLVQVTDTNGCVDLDSMQVTIFLANISNDTLICKGDYLQVNTFGDSPSSIIWTPTTSISDPLIQNPILSPTEPTTYLAYINNTKGCTIIDTLNIEVPYLEANFDTIVSPSCDGVEIQFINTSDENLDYYWVFSDHEISYSNEVTKTFFFGSDYFGSLFVEDTNGCVESNTYFVSMLKFDDYFTVNEPNVFTPNADGENDEFIIQIPEKVQSCAELTIYNRWGQVQYFSVGNDLKWDGRNNVGIPVPTGTYFYTLIIKDKTFSGILELILD